VTEQSAPDTGSEAKGTTGQSIRDLVERTLLVGMGAAAFTKDRLQEVVEEFVRRGQISGEEGRDMMDRLLNRSRDEARSALKRADSSLQGAYRDMGLITRRELEDMEFRVRQLEHRVQLLEAAADGSGSDAQAGGSSTEPAGA
jgi:polyhydroxyalkanoate synthesis regulator phasin